MRLLIPIGTFVLLIASCHCLNSRQNPSSPDPTIGATPENLDAVSQSVTNLAQKISLAIANPKSKTEIFSPVSIAGALSLLLLGSGGDTREELMNVMGFRNTRLTFTDIHKSFGRLFQDLVSNEAQNVSIPWRENDKCNNYDYDDEDDYQPKEAHRGKRDTDSHFISVANGVFVDNSLPLNSRYENLTRELYAGEISKMALYGDPVGASNRINNWVQQATRNKIRQIVSPEQVSNAPMVLASALYFKAKWETMFIEPDTRPRPFYLNGRNAAPIDIDTMATSGCFPFYEDKQHDAKIVGLPYQEGKSTMYIIVPNQSDRQKLRNLQNVMSLQDWNKRIDQMVVKTGTFLMPKMKIENALGLRDVLNHLGLRDVFNPERSDLTAITRDDPILLEMSRIPFDKPTPAPHQISTTTNNYRPTKNKQTTRTPATSQTTPQNRGEISRIPFDKPTPAAHQISTTTNNYRPTKNRQATRTPTTSQTTPQNRGDLSFSNNGNRQTFSNQTWNTKPVYQPPTTTITNFPQKPATSINTQPTNIPWLFDLDATHCNMINYCFYDIQRNHCNCVANLRLAPEQSVCSSRPFIVQTKCQSGRLLLSFRNIEICVVDWYDKQTCRKDCHQWHKQCYCCSQYPQTSQLPTSEQSVENQHINNYHPSKTPTIEGGINHRFGNHPEPPRYSTSRPSPIQKCEQVCGWFSCWYVGDCTLASSNNYHRNKRQTPTLQQPKLFVGDVLHKVSLDINEQGTEGGAVTAIVIDRISSSFNLRVDGPFLIYLRNDVTKLPLFYGAVFDPRS